MKRFRDIVLSVVVLAAMTMPGWGAEIGGVDLPNTLKAGDTDLRFNGGGVRKKYFMDMYAGGLYLKAPSSNALQIIRADEPMAIRLHILSSMITSDRMEEATREGFDASTGGNTAPIQKEIDAFINVFKTEIKVGDVYDLVYLPGKGVEVLKNGKSESVTEGLPLKRALFGIWLSDNPIQKDLKAGMLGH